MPSKSGQEAEEAMVEKLQACCCEGQLNNKVHRPGNTQQTTKIETNYQFTANLIL